MVEVGQYGRLPPGESWQRAMDRVRQLHAEGAKRRYRVTGRQVEPGWWTYRAVKISPSREAYKDDVRDRNGVKPLTRQRAAQLAAKMPRCAQRARAHHGGDSKVAWPTLALAWRVADVLGGSAYECKLPAPAIGQHWHTTSRKKSRGYR
jgi:hypothetical protein